MGNKATPPRSFNTIRHSQTKERAKRRQQERVVLLSIAATIILILLCLVVLLVCNIANAFAGRPDDGNQDDSGMTDDPSETDEIVYQQSTKTKHDIHVGELILVNSTHEYLFPSIPLVSIRTERDKNLVNGANPYQVDPGYQMHENAFADFHSMMVKYYLLEENGAITVTGAYRTKKEQEDMTSSITSPGFSDHHTGYCLALRSNSNGGYLDSQHWIYQYCHNYGFIVRYPADKTEETGISGYEYCFRYVGIPHATYIAKYGLCMEEYISLLQKDYSADDHLKIDCEDGTKYEVYYVPASGEELTTIRVPKNYAYTISGDNDSGFIVTVNLSAPQA